MYTDNIYTDLYILLKPQSELGYLGCYETERSNSNTISKNILKTELTSDLKQNLLGQLMFSSDPVLVNLFSKYLSYMFRTACFTTRDKCLKSATS